MAVYLPARIRVTIYSILSVILMIDVLDSTVYYKKIKVIDDLPKISRLPEYLLSLEKIIVFVNKHREFVDMNMCFGLFLVNANLRYALQAEEHLLTVDQRKRMHRLVTTNYRIIMYYKKNVQKLIPKTNSMDPIFDVPNLFLNDVSWPRRLKKLNVRLLDKTLFLGRKELEFIYLKWHDFLKRVEESRHYMAYKGASCMGLLAKNPVNHLHMSRCLIPYQCVKSIANGTNFGFGLTRRILFLIMARYSRCCSLLTSSKDQNLLDTLCVKAYSEAEFIFHHRFELPNLILEQASLCSIEGHAQFLRQSWIDELLEFQTPLGCFNETRPSKTASYEDDNKVSNNFTWLFTRAERMILGNKCSLYTTSSAAAFLAAAIRYILENIFSTNNYVV